MIIVVGIGIALVLAVFYNLVFGKEREINNVVEPVLGARSLDGFIVVLKQTGAMVKQQSGNEVVVEYQGGTFVYTYHPEGNVTEIIYPNFYQMKCEDATKAMRIMNDLNTRSLFWMLYTHKGNPGEEELMLNASLSYTCATTCGDEKLIEHLKILMAGAFRLAHDFVGEFNSDKWSNDFKGICTKNDFINKILYMQNRLEAGRGDVTEKQDIPDGAMKLLSLINAYEEADWGCPKRIQIMADGCPTIIEDVREMMDFDLNTFIRSRSGAYPEAASILACFEKGDLQINVNKVEGCTEKSLFYKIILNRIPHENEKISMGCKASLIEVRLTNERDMYWEAKYMIDDALDKKRRGKFDDMTDEQRMVANMVEPSVYEDVYWAKKYYNAGCYFQSLPFFRKVYSYLAAQFHELSEENKEFYYEICFYIGFLYMDLNMHERAFYFLERAKAGGNMQCHMEYVNCLCNMNDPFAMECITDYINRTTEYMKGESEPNEMLLDFYHFLCRRYVYVLIEQHKYDEAEKRLNDMIAEEGPNAEFARGELEYLKAKKNGGNND